MPVIQTSTAEDPDVALAAVTHGTCGTWGTCGTCGSMAEVVRRCMDVKAGPAAVRLRHRLIVAGMAQRV
jgi:hypothetical protein